MPVRQEMLSSTSHNYLSAGLIASGVLGLGVLFSALGSFYTINQTERGVLLTNGAFSRVIQPGLNFKLPWIQSIYKIDVITHNVAYKDMEAYSADQQPAKLRISVTYHIAPDKMEDMYSRFAGNREDAVDRLIRPTIYKDVKVVFGQYSAAKAISDRGQLNLDVTNIVIKAIAYDPVIAIESIQVEDVEFSKEYVLSIEARMKAEVQVQQMQQQLNQEKIKAEIAVTQAKGRADSVRAEAEANAARTRLIGEAEAYAIDLRGKALASNPKIIDLTAVEKWSGNVPQQMIPGSTVPFLNLSPPERR